MKSETGTRKSALLVLVTLWAVGAPFAHAQELITNCSFENTASTFVDQGGGVMNADLIPGATTIPGWTIISDQLGWIMNGNQYGPATPCGSFSLDLTGSHDDASFAGVSQTIATTPNETYALSLWLGADQDNGLFAGTKSVVVTAGTARISFSYVPTGSGNQWGRVGFKFTASSSSTPITIVGTSSGSGVQYLGLDSVSVVPASALSVGPPGSADFALSAFPNPASGHLTVTFSLPTAAHGTVRLIDVTGHCIQREDVTAAGGGLHALPWVLPAGIRPGIYFFELEQPPRRVVTRLTVLH